MSKFSEQSQHIIDVNLKWRFENQPERINEIIKDFVHELKLALRTEYNYNLRDIGGMEANTVIETWYKEHSKNKKEGYA